MDISLAILRRAREGQSQQFVQLKALWRAGQQFLELRRCIREVARLIRGFRRFELCIQISCLLRAHDVGHASQKDDNRGPKVKASSSHIHKDQPTTTSKQGIPSQTSPQTKT